MSNARPCDVQARAAVLRDQPPARAALPARPVGVAAGVLPVRVAPVGRGIARAADRVVSALLGLRAGGERGEREHALCPVGASRVGGQGADAPAAYAAAGRRLARRLAVAAALALAATAAQAGNVACTTARVNDGLCPNTSHRLLFYPIPNADPDGAGPRKGMAVEIADAICSPSIGNYQATLEDGAPNPETCADFADRWIKSYLRQKVLDYLKAQKDADAAAALAAETVPELP
jgi:hypothetical protein